MSATRRIRSILTALSIVVVAGTLIGAAAWHPARDVPVTQPAAKPAAQAPMVGFATGEYHNGAAVYRLPSIEVTASRRDAQ